MTIDIGTAARQAVFTRWNPSRLMEWAKYGHSGEKYNLTCSGIPCVQRISDIPGGPFDPTLSGQNFTGHEGLKSLLARAYGVATEQVLIAQGASQCNYLIAGAVLQSGGTAIVETPVYDPILRAVESWATTVIRLPRRRENGYLPNPDELRRLLTNDTKLISLTNLHNPSHVRIDRKLMAELVNIASRAGAVVMVDEVYLPMVERDNRQHSHSVGAISLCSLDKSWGLDALRVGWAVGPKELVWTAYRLNNLLGVNQPYMTEDLAWRILDKPEAVDWLIRRAESYVAHRPMLNEFLTRTPRVKAVPAAGGISTLIELPDGTDDLKFSRRLLEEHETAVFPGSLFEAPGTFRVSMGGPRENIQGGLERLHDFVTHQFQ